MPDEHRFTTNARGLSGEGEASWGDDWSNEIADSTGVDVANGTVGPATGPPGPTDGLVARWPFDDDSTTGTLVDTVGGYDATLSGGTYTSDRNGTVVRFDGTDEYGEGTVPITQSFTVSIWGRSAQSGSWSDPGVLFSARDGNGFIVHSEQDAEAWRGFVLDSTDDSYHLVGDSDQSIPDITAWHLYTLTYDHGSGTARTFLDGSEVRSETFSIARESDTITFRFGRDTRGNGDRYLDGSLDDARLYSRALSATEVSDLYDATK